MPTLVIFAVAGEEGNFRSSPANHGEYDEESYVFCTLLFNKSFWFANKSFFTDERPGPSRVHPQAQLYHGQ
jgi:hypothetical protein